MPACSKDVSSPVPTGSSIPESSVGQRTHATNKIMFGLADKDRFFSAYYPAISKDGGKSWRLAGPCLYDTATPRGDVISRMGARAPDWAYAWGPGGDLVKVTHDGGAHWFEAKLSTIQDVTSKGRTLRAALQNSTATYVSNDYGMTWSLHQAGQ